MGLHTLSPVAERFGMVESRDLILHSFVAIATSSMRLVLSVRLEHLAEAITL